MRQFVPELFFAPRQPLSDDEKEDGKFFKNHVLLRVVDKKNIQDPQ